MYKKAHSSSTLNNKTGVLSTPYASRNNMARIGTDYPKSLNRTMAWKKTYFSLSDPHLTRYFQNKLLASIDRESSSRPSSCLSTPRSRASTVTGGALARPVSRSARAHGQCGYKLSVRTGPSSDAGTSARVYVTLKGSRDEVRRRRLTRGGRREFSFSPGSLERFRVHGKDVGELKQIMIESEGLKLTDAWFVESLTVTNEEGKKWHCPCNQWLSLHHSDCQLSRTLKAKPYPTKTRPESDPFLTAYTIEVHTGNVRGGGTCANVFVTLTGSKGTSSKTLVKSDDDRGNFDRGSVVTSQLECADIGRIKSLTIEHDNSGFGPDWFLDKVVVYRSEKPEKKAYFQCRQWLSRTEGDGAIQRVLQPSSSPPEPSVGKTYLVSTQTGYQRGAGTDANVYVTLYGSLGSSGERMLDNHPANFERGRKDTFSIQCSDLGELIRVKVRHDNSGSGPSWLLDSVEVKYEDTRRDRGGVSDEGQRAWQFPCGQWLEVCEGCGGNLEIELEVGGQPEAKSTSDKQKESFPYKVQTLTGTCPGAGTNANVYIILHGRDNHSGKIWLDNGRRTFLPRQQDEFDITTNVRVFPLETVTVGHDNSGPGPGWFLDKVTVVCPRSGSSWDFPCGRWFCMDSGDGRIERELHPLVVGGSERSEVEGRGNWEVRVWTSDIRGAGTDANVTLQVHCQNGSSQPIPLGDNVANFEQGECDIFPNVPIPVTAQGGSIESITLAHDNTNPYPDWHLDKVVLINHHTGEEYITTCGKWLSSEKGDCGTSINLKVTPKHSGDKKHSSTTQHRASHTHATNTPTHPHPPSISIDPTQTLRHTPALPLPTLNFSTPLALSKNQSHNAPHSHKSTTTPQHATTSEPIRAHGVTFEHQNGHGIAEEGGRDKGVDDYDGDDFESGSEVGSEVETEEEEGQSSFRGGERSDAEADRHDDDTFGDTQELDSSITNQYLRQLRYEQLSSIDSSRAQDGAGTPHHSSHSISKAFSPATSPMAANNTIPYTIHVVAGAPPAVRPVPYLIVTLLGTRGHTHPIKLEPVEDGYHTTGSNVGTETFSVEGANVGSITAIKVRLEGASPSPPWLLNEINVYSPTSGHTHHFPWGCGIQPGKRLVIERVDQQLGSSLNTSTLASSPRNGSTSSGLVAYEVHVSTADKKYAGANNNLHLILVGDKSSSKDFKMKNSTRNPKLQRGQTDTFNIAAPNLLGNLKFIKIAHCPRNLKPSADTKSRPKNPEMDEKWYLFQVVLVRLTDQKKYYFLCRRWIAPSETSRQLRYTEVPLAKIEKN